MAGLKQTIIRGGLESLYFTGAHLALRPLVGGVGAILTLHHVRPPRPDRFQPNRLLEVTPRFLAGVVRHLRRSGVDVVSLDEMHRRMTEGDFRGASSASPSTTAIAIRLQWAYPILKEAGVPFAIYVPTSFPDRLGELWWLVLEAVIARNDRIGLAIDGRNRTFDCRTVAEKRALYDELYWWLRARPTEAEMREHRPRPCGLLSRRRRGVLRRTLHELAGACRTCRRSAGHHRRPYGQSPDAGETAGRSRALGNGTEPLGHRGGAVGRGRSICRYPYRRPRLRGRARIRDRRRTRLQDRGDDAAGRAVPARTAEHCTALPRISLNGEYQRLRYVRVLLSGSATAMWNGFRRVEAA